MPRRLFFAVLASPRRIPRRVLGCRLRPARHRAEAAEDINAGFKDPDAAPQRWVE